jgi:hypothetical protein
MSKKIEESQPMLPENAFRLSKFLSGKSNGEDVEYSLYRNISTKRTISMFGVIDGDEGEMPDNESFIEVLYNNNKREYVMAFIGRDSHRRLLRVTVTMSSNTRHNDIGKCPVDIEIYDEKSKKFEKERLHPRTAPYLKTLQCKILLTWAINHYAELLCYNLLVTDRQRHVKYLYEPSRVMKIYEKYKLDISCDPKELDKYINDPQKLLE